VPKVHNKPIQVKRKGSKLRSKSVPKAALVWRTGLSGVPPDCVRCTREIDSELASFGNFGGRSAIIHRTVRCNTGLSDVPAEQRLLRANGRLQRTLNALQCAPARRNQSRRQKTHRTVYRTCPVHHRNVRWPSCRKLQPSEPNGLVTWLAHRTVRCAIRQKPSPTAILVVEAINTPNHHSSRYPSIHYTLFNTRAIHNTPRHKSKPSIESKSPIQL
jgi:hypothetical protein